jgi:phospho-N-acetylmuramoyl-pentapeptide-transferase
MILLFAQYLFSKNPEWSFLNVFQYLSTRMILSMITAIILSTVIYPPFILRLRALKLGQPIRELGPASHMEKKGTPTMGGLVLVLTTLLSALLWIDLSNTHFVTLSIITAGYCFVGFLDDYLKISKKNSKGLSSKKKMLGLILVSSIALAWHIKTSPVFANSSGFIIKHYIQVPFFKDTILDFGVFFIPFLMLVLLGSSNAVNLTDGLDGLVIGPVITCSLALLCLCYVTGNSVLAKYLYYHTIPGSGEITVFLSALIGASIGFLWFNTWPAQVFMGDSGSLPLGGILGMVAIITSHEFLLVIMGGLFVVEALSVIIQVVSFKTTQKRVFKMAPIHHHFEKMGFPEQKITIRAWIISFMLALLSILTLKLR